MAISPCRCSTLLLHPDNQSPDHRERIQHNLSRVAGVVSQAIEEALAREPARDRDELLRVKEMVESMINIGNLRRNYREHCERLDGLRSSLPIRSLWVLNPKVWRARLERGRLKKQLLEAEATESRIWSQIAWR